MALNSDLNMILCKLCANAIDGEVFRLSCMHYLCIECKSELEESIIRRRCHDERIYCCKEFQTYVLCGNMSRIRSLYIDKKNESMELKKLREEKKDVEDENKQLKEGLASLNDTVVELKAQLDKKPDDAIECSDCKECYTEKKMYICNTCTGSSASSSKKKNKKLDLKSIGLCSNCVVMDHIVQKHEVVPLFPVLAESQYQVASNNIAAEKRAYKNKFAKNVDLWKRVEELSDVLIEYIDTTTGMIKTSKSSTFQQEFKEFISLKVNEFNDKICGVEDHLRSDVDKLNEMLTNFNSQVSEMCNDKCTNVDDILNTLKQLLKKHQ